MVESNLINSNALVAIQTKVEAMSVLMCRSCGNIAVKLKMAPLRIGREHGAEMSEK